VRGEGGKGTGRVRECEGRLKKDKKNKQDGKDKKGQP
jgi:hypothetical protein